MAKAISSYCVHRWALCFYVMALAVVAVWYFNAGSESRPSEVPTSIWLEDREVINVSFNTVDELEAHLDSLGLRWIPSQGDKIPKLSLDTFPPDISQVSDISRKKSLFFRGLLPVVLLENYQISTQRNYIFDLMAVGHQNLNELEAAWLQSMSAWYRIKSEPDNQDFWLELLRRVDVIPPALVLAQAANESAWGGSRFAQQGNNLFGLWTYDEHNGMIPAERKAGEKHAVQMFSSLRASVRAYMRNLNTHRAYEAFRKTRAELRKEGKPLQASILAEGLLPYSQRGAAYVDEIQRMIKGNQLVTLQGVSIDVPSVGNKIFQ